MSQANTTVKVSGSFGDYTIVATMANGAAFNWPATVHMFPSPMTDVAAVIQRVIDDVYAAGFKAGQSTPTKG